MDNDVIFRKSKKKDKKYDVILPDNTIVSFGSIEHKHYFDNTPLKLYKHLNHNDNKRRALFRKRFMKLYENNKNNRKSSIYWSWKYLW